MNPKKNKTRQHADPSKEGFFERSPLRERWKNSFPGSFTPSGDGRLQPIN
jgi:hypothetical protein